ncbi:M4 family metallopeptidase [Nocardioides sp. cx-169]
MDVYMTSGTTYAQARTATLSAAADLYGAGSAQHRAVASAWSAVSVS